MSPLDFFTDLFNPNLAFLPRALGVAVLSAIVCAVVGTHVVLRGSAFLTDAVSHAVFPGVAVAFLMGGNILIGGAVAGIVTAILITVLGHGRLLKDDSAIGVVFVAAFALGLLIMSKSATYSGSLESFLFGSIAGVDPKSIPYLLVASVVVVGLVLLLNRAFSMVTLDRESARALGLPVFALDIALNVLVTVAIVLALSTVGNILVVALLIAPAASARLFTDSVSRMMIIGPVLGAVATVVGMWASWTWDAPVGACIVLACAAVFVLARLFAPRHGLLMQRRAGKNTPSNPSSSSDPANPSDPSGGRGSRLRTVGVPAAAAAAVVLAGVNLVSPLTADAVEQPEREYVHNQHVDATHLHWDNAKGLRLDMVVGAHTIRPSDDIVLDLQPQTYQGRDVSKITLPEGGPDLSFLGKPGQTLWNAPQGLFDDWKPVWVGVGAGDVPASKIDPGHMRINLVKVDGPSWVEVYQATSWDVSRAFSSRDSKYQRFPVNEHAHGHYNWTFGAPGRYEMYFQGEGEHPSTGAPVKSNLEKVVWQVGPKQAGQARDVVGPESPRYVKGGTTPAPTNPAPTNPAPSTPAPKPTTPVPSPKPTSPVPNPGGSTSPQTPSTPSRPDGSSPNTCSRVIDRGHVDMAVLPKGNGFEAKLKDESRGAAVLRNPSDVVLHVNDALKVTVPKGFGQVAPAGASIWMIPTVQRPGGIWSGFNTEQIDYSKLNGPVSVALASASGPGRVVLFSEDIVDGIRVHWDSAKKPAGAFQLVAPSHVHQSMAFDRPGMYQVTVRYSAKAKDGRTISADAPYTITVGGAACAGSPAGTPDGTSAPSGPVAGVDDTGFPSGSGPIAGDAPIDEISSPTSGTAPGSADLGGGVTNAVTVSDVPADSGATSSVDAGSGVSAGAGGDAGLSAGLSGDGSVDSSGDSGALNGSVSGMAADGSVADSSGADDSVADDSAVDESAGEDSKSSDLGPDDAAASRAGKGSNSAAVSVVGSRGGQGGSGQSRTQLIVLSGAGLLFASSAAAWAITTLRDRKKNLA